MNRTSERALGEIFAIPIVLALASAVGLIAALVGDGLFDVVSWIALGTVAGVPVWAYVRPTTTRV